MRVHDLRLDCDGDAILYVVDANGPSCHTMATSCFFRSVTVSGLAADDGPAPVAAK
jgi:phosphoribosyl-AMP cyclohydrolase